MKKIVRDNIKLAADYVETLKQLVSSLDEAVSDSDSMTEAWNKIDRFYQDANRLRNTQKCTDSKSFGILTGDSVEGHTKYLQGIDLPIGVNCISNGNEMVPSEVAEMHIGQYNGSPMLLLTPSTIALD